MEQEKENNGANNLESVLKAVLKCMDEESMYRIGYNYLRRKGNTNLAIIEKLKEYPNLLNSYMSGAKDYLKDSKDGRIDQEILVEMD